MVNFDLLLEYQAFNGGRKENETGLTARDINMNLVLNDSMNLNF